MHKKTLLLTLFCLVAIWAKAQYSQYLFENVQSISGLPSNRILCIAKDSLGFFWYGTTLGLSRSDGRRYEAFTFKPGDTTGIPSQHIRQIIVDRNNVLWIRSADGMLFIYDASKPFNHRFKTIDYRNSDDTPIAYQLLLYNEKDTIYAFEKGGLVTAIFTDSLKATYTSYIKGQKKEDVPYNIWSGTYLNGKCWLTSNKGLLAYDSGDRSLSTVLSPEDYDKVEIKSHELGQIERLDNDRLLISVSRTSQNAKGLFIYEIKKEVFQKTQLKTTETKDYNKENVYRLFRLRDMEFICLPQGNAPFYYNFELDMIDTFTLDWYGRNKLNTESVGCAYLDENNRLILGSNQGLFIHNPYNYIFKDYLPFETERRFPNSICNTHNDRKRGMLILGFKSGMIVEYDTLRKKAKRETTIPDIQYLRGQRMCPAMVPLSQDQLIIISFGVYLFDLNAFTFRNIHQETASPSKDSRLLSVLDTFSAQRELIFVLDRKLYRMNLHTLEINFQGEICPDDENEELSALLLDSKKRLWITTRRNVIYSIDDKHPGHLRMHNLTGYEDARINDAVIDANDRLWLASYPYGLLSCQETGAGIFKTDAFGLKEGLLSDSVISLIPDEYGKIWLAHKYGISRFDVSQEQFVNYEKRHGINFPHNMNYGKAKDEHGQLYLSEGIGIVQFQPADFLRKRAPPPVYISEFSVLGMETRSFWKDTTITLDWKQDNPAFTISAVNHTHAGMNQYKYMMEGLHNNWEDLSREHLRVTFTNLNPGKYVFKVIAANHEGTWNYDGINISLNILPPFWKTWWFLILTIVFVIGFVLTGFYLKIKQVRKQELLLIQKEIETQAEERNRIAQDLHDDIGAQLSTIKMYIHAMDSMPTPEENKELKKGTEQLISNTIQEMRRIIRDLSPQTLAAYGYEAAVNELAYNLKKSGNISIAIDIKFFDNDLDIIEQTALFRITQELFNNTIKHSGAKHIFLKLWSEEESHIMSYKDDGRGLIAADGDPGNGFYNIKTRTKFLRGKSSFGGRKEEGFAFNLFFPRKK